jgi:UPF0755 protein
MIDELDLAFDERAERGRPRHRRPPRGGKKTGARSAVAFLLAFILLAVLGGGAYFGYSKIKGFFTAADYDGPGTGQVTVQIAPNASLTEMGNALVEKDVVKSTKAFVDAAEDNPKGKNIQDGTYRLRKQMSAKLAVAALLDPKNRLVIGVTIPEGLSYKATFEKLSQATKIPVKDFEAAAKDPVALGVPDWWFNRTDGKKAARTVEGFLFPATYEFPPNADATTILRTMVEHFNSEVERLGFVDTVQKQRKISPYEALIAASIAQAEALHDKDMGPVVRVLYNRVYTGRFPCKCLGLDSTVNYWLRITGQKTKASEHLTQAELHNPKNPYNTHDIPGMPIGPIGNPGEAALKGAMNPPPSSNYYFISIDKKGTMAYAKDWAGHQANIKLACRNGIPLC